MKPSSLFLLLTKSLVCCVHSPFDWAVAPRSSCGLLLMGQSNINFIMDQVGAQALLGLTSVMLPSLIILQPVQAPIPIQKQQIQVKRQLYLLQESVGSEENPQQIQSKRRISNDRPGKHSIILFWAKLFQVDDQVSQQGYSKELHKKSSVWNKQPFWRYVLEQNVSDHLIGYYLDSTDAENKERVKVFLPFATILLITLVLHNIEAILRKVVRTLHDEKSTALNKLCNLHSLEINTDPEHPASDSVSKNLLSWANSVRLKTLISF
ncbi:hypothetical protein EGW08_022196 [Elysia chlorotica]|uniref:Uncharacterized protein n=1 Tax=Elysia chlorotica TaxID=188477 RepID=A0A433SLK9_ELYCH|nr:hypothetical protein EGW08_022196 [Elysia chlorotica]